MENLAYFLDCVIPVAEEAGVKLAMHPDDPPLSPIHGLGRIMRSIENYQRLIDLRPSPVNGVALCQGNFSLMTADLPGPSGTSAARTRYSSFTSADVRGTPEKFIETFHDDGQTDMVECMRAIATSATRACCGLDHVPTMAGDTNDTPAYSSIGRLFAIGYISGCARQRITTIEDCRSGGSYG